MITHGSEGSLRCWLDRLSLWRVCQRAPSLNTVDRFFPDPRNTELRDRGAELAWRQAVARNHVTKTRRARNLAASMAHAPHVPTLGLDAVLAAMGLEPQ